MENKTKQKMLFFAGLCFALAAAMFMIDGNIFGNRTIPAAIVFLISGIGMISTSKYRLLK
jgi:hypothetical protein